ncbi:hypothetical protein GDO78_019467, partial [Eleutherodactylus coqui]
CSPHCPAHCPPYCPLHCLPHSFSALPCLPHCPLPSPPLRSALCTALPCPLHNILCTALCTVHLHCPPHCSPQRSPVFLSAVFAGRAVLRFLTCRHIDYLLGECHAGQAMTQR